jgi:hypothetical protein
MDNYKVVEVKIILRFWSGVYSSCMVSSNPVTKMVLMHIKYINSLLNTD